MSRIHPLIGMGPDQMVKRLIGRDSEEASDAHSCHYEAFKDEIKAFPKAADLIEEAVRRGARAVLATSADEDDLPPLTDAIGAGDAVDHVVSKSDVDKSKPAPDIFAAALDALDLDPATTLVVGDTPWDVEAAAKLDLQVVCVLTGGATREQAGRGRRHRRLRGRRRTARPVRRQPPGQAPRRQPPADAG